MQLCPWWPSSVDPGVPAPPSQISMSHGWGNMTGRRPGWSQNHRRAIGQEAASHRAQTAPPHGPRGAASPRTLLSPLSGEVLAELLSSLLFRVFPKTETGSSCFQVEAPRGSPSQSGLWF